MIAWLKRSIQVLIDYADYRHLCWAQPQMDPKHPDYHDKVCRPIYEYRRKYGWR